MNLQGQIKQEIKAYDENILEKLSLQDALIILSLYVCCLDPENCTEEAETLAEVFRSHPAFMQISEERPATLERIHKYSNLLKHSEDFQNSIDKVITHLATDKKESALRLAAQACRQTGLTEVKNKRLREMARKLSLSNRAVEEIIE